MNMGASLALLRRVLTICACTQYAAASLPGHVGGDGRDDGGGLGDAPILLDAPG